MRKLLNTLYITDETVFMTLDGENIVCKREGKDVFRLPFANIESIFCFSYLGCSPALMGKCAAENVALNFLSPSGRFLARVTGPVKGNVFLRKQQILKFDDNEVSLNLIRNGIAAKIHNSRFVLKRTLHDYPETDDDGTLSSCVQQLGEAIDEVYVANDSDILRGIEGNSAKVYFHVFDKLIRAQKEQFRFFERTKRPPLDRINAVLSFLYTIATCDIASALEGVGLDPYIGFFHTLRPGRCSLACDLAEEQRAVIDRLVLTMINLRIINGDDFEEQESGAVFLTADGRKKVLKEWQEKKKTEIIHPVLKEKIKLGLLPFVQANLLAKFVREELDEYPPFILR